MELVQTSVCSLLIDLKNFRSCFEDKLGSLKLPVLLDLLPKEFSELF